mgnify:CR=1 FL=1
MRRFAFLVGAMAAALTMTGCGSGGEPDAEPELRPSAATTVESDEVLALVNGVLIDGTGAAPLLDASLVIQGARIVEIGSRPDLDVPQGAEVIDVQGSTILPGFVNSHVHLGFEEDRLLAWAQEGVTTVRDLGVLDSSSELFVARDALLLDSRYARLVAAGPMVSVPGGYPVVPSDLPELGLLVTSPDDAAAKIHRLLDDGADVIKIALERGSIWEMEIPALSPQEAAAVVAAAHERGTLVSAHVTAAEDLQLALDAGVDDIAHMVVLPRGEELDPELIERMVENDVYWVPTLELWRIAGSLYTDPAIAHLTSFVEAGGKVALGTDYAGYRDEGQFDLGMPITEIELMQQAGMTPMQIIVAATKNGAHVCNLDHELGTLEAGKIADVLVVSGDPLEDIHNLTNTRIVIHGGEVIRNDL